MLSAQKMQKMNPHLQQIIKTVEPLKDSVYGLCYRCSLTLKDETERKDSGLKSLSEIVSRYTFGQTLLNIDQIIFSITEPQTR